MLLPSFLGPWAHTTLAHGGAEAPAVAGDQSKGALWLCLEGPAHERVRGGEDLPHSGGQPGSLGKEPCYL